VRLGHKRKEAEHVEWNFMKDVKDLERLKSEKDVLRMQVRRRRDGWCRFQCSSVIASLRSAMTETNTFR
jgi:hypothetical protein